MVKFIKYIRVILILMISISVIVFFSGCTTRELDQIAIVTSMQISKAEDQTMIYAEIIQMGSPDDMAGKSSSIISASGKTLKECLITLNETESRELYLGHLRIILLSTSYLETATPDELSKLADFALKSPQIRFNILLAATDDTTETALKAETTSSKNRGIDLSNEIRKNAVIYDIRDLINCISYYRNTIKLPVANTEKTDEKEYLTVSPGTSYELNIFESNPAVPTERSTHE